MNKTEFNLVHDQQKKFSTIMFRWFWKETKMLFRECTANHVIATHGSNCNYLISIYIYIHTYADVYVYMHGYIKPKLFQTQRTQTLIVSIEDPFRPSVPYCRDAGRVSEGPWLGPPVRKAVITLDGAKFIHVNSCNYLSKLWWMVGIDNLIPFCLFQFMDTWMDLQHMWWTNNNSWIRGSIAHVMN